MFRNEKGIKEGRRKGEGRRKEEAAPDIWN